MILRLKRLFLLSSSGVLIGLAFSCLVAMLIMATKLERMGKDVNEIVVVWFYMAIFATISGLSGAIGTGSYLVYRGKL